MSDYTLSKTLEKSYDETVDAVKAGLSEQGFGVLTEIDMAATMNAKLGVTIEPQVILGACRPQLAYEAIKADPSIAAVLPCNVVVRSQGDSTVVEIFDPAAMMSLSPAAVDENSPLATVAADARERLNSVLEKLN